MCLFTEVVVRSVFLVPCLSLFRIFCLAYAQSHEIKRGLLQKSWQHNFSEISKAPTGISKFAAERQQRLFSNDAA
jgi:hypothetical protein